MKYFMHRLILTVFFLFFLVICLFSQSIKINEVMSSNGSTIADEDGDYSDWLELYNSGPTSFDLNGFSLTDDPDSLQKWRFGSIEMAPNEFLLIFASDKDRQGEVYYWNTIIDWGDEWVYRLGTSEPPSDWNTVEFDESGWLKGPTGIG